MSSHNPNPDPRYLYHSPPKNHQQNSNRKSPIAQIQHQQQRGIMHYLSPSSSTSRTTANNSTTIINQSQQLYYSNNTSLPPNSFISPTTTAIPGGSARVQPQPNHLNSNYTVGNNGVHQIPLKKSRTSDKAGIEDFEDRSATPDSTTEPPPRPAKPSFKQGDDVFFRTDDGQHILGTVGMIHGQTLQILFGDGTQQWASFKRVKKLSCAVKDEEEPERINMKSSKQGSSSVADQSAANAMGVNNSEEITCGSCGIVKVMKRVAGRKALNYAPHTAQQFNCRRCLNKSSCNNNNLPRSTILISQPVGRGKTIHLPASTGAKSSAELRRGTIESNSRPDICFHCEGNTTYNDRLHCNLCERACHLSCLSITPIPLEGDRFWDVICSACGTQNGESGSTGRTKVFSCRRSITSWSDVAHLVLSCLGTQNQGEKFFDLDLQVIPFIEESLDRLHLPRAYKNTAEKHMFLKTALGNAKLRFLNGKDVNKKDTLWAIRDNNNHQGYPLRVPSSTSSSSATSKTSKAPPPPATKALNQTSVKSSLNSRYGVPSDTPLRVHPTSAFANGGSTISSDVHSNVVASIPLLNSSLKGNASPRGTGSISPIRSSNVSSTQHETGAGYSGCAGVGEASGLSSCSESSGRIPVVSLEIGKRGRGRPRKGSSTSSNEFQVEHTSPRSSRTLGVGKSGRKGLSPQGKKQEVLLGPSPSKDHSKFTVSATGKASAIVIGTTHSGRYVVKSRSQEGKKDVRKKDGSSDSNSSDLDENVLEATTESESEDEVSTGTQFEKTSLMHKTTTHHLGAVGQVETKKRKLSAMEASDMKNMNTKGSNGSAMLSSTSPVDATATNKRPRLSDDLQISGALTKIPLKMKTLVDQADKGNKLNRPSSVMLSPIGSKMSDIYKSLNGNVGVGINGKNLSEGQSMTMPVSPTKSQKIESATSSEITGITGKAVKTATITSPGNHASAAVPVNVKPSLRIRKPKVSPESGGKDPKKEKDVNDGSGAVKKTGVKKIVAGIGRGKGRGRPLKLTNAGNGHSNNHTPIVSNGETVNSNHSDGSEFSILKSTVEDLLLYGAGCTVQFLPKAPQTAAEHAKLKAQVADLFASEDKPSPPSYWKSSENGASSNLRWQKSSRDMSNLDSYTITGRKVDQNGQVMYYHEWKDGFGNDSDYDENEPMYNMDDVDLNDPIAILAKLNMDKNGEDNSPSVEEMEMETDEVVEIISGDRTNEKVEEDTIIIEAKRISLDSNSIQVGNREKDKDKDLFMVSGLGLRKKNNLTLKNLHGPKRGEIIDLTDSP